MSCLYHNTFLLLKLQLEERIDSLSKEARSHRNSLEASQLTVGELREGLKQVSYV